MFTLLLSDRYIDVEVRCVLWIFSTWTGNTAAEVSFDRKLHCICIAMLKKKGKTKLSTNIGQTIQAITIKHHINDYLRVLLRVKIVILMIRNRHVARPVLPHPPIKTFTQKHNNTTLTTTLIHILAWKYISLFKNRLVLQVINVKRKLS